MGEMIIGKKKLFSLEIDQSRTNGNATANMIPNIENEDEFHAVIKLMTDCRDDMIKQYAELKKVMA